jgi:Icc-related predicted phosphoesterase
VRCHYLSDLHLEAQDFSWTLPRGDVLIVAGDLCHAACLDPGRRDDPYAARQRERVQRFAEMALNSFARVLLIAGNHDHYDGVFEETIGTLHRYLPGITVLDDEAVEIGGVQFFGATLWSDFEGGSATAMEKGRRGVGEYFFVRTRQPEEDGGEQLTKLRPAHTAAAFDRSLAALRQHLAATAHAPTVVISHHAPSRKGLNPFHAGNGLDGAYASNLDDFIASLERVPFWVHGHTHIRRQYRIGGTQVVTNARGFDARDPVARSFSPVAFFDL